MREVETRRRGRGGTSGRRGGRRRGRRGGRRGCISTGDSGV